MRYSVSQSSENAKVSFLNHVNASGRSNGLLSILTWELGLDTALPKHKNSGNHKRIIRGLEN